MPLLETAYLLNPGTRRRRARRARGRRARRRDNAWRGQRRRHAAAARKGWRSRHRRRDNPRRRRAGARRGRRRGRRRRNAVDYFGAAMNPRRRKGGRRAGRRRGRRRNPVGGGAISVGGMRLGFPEVIPGVRVPLPGTIGTIVNGAVQGVLAGGIVFAGYFGSGALVEYIVSRTDARAAESRGETFKGLWARPLLFAGASAVLGGVAAAVAPRNKRLLWSILAAAGPAVRAFGGLVYALLGGAPAVQETGFKGDLAAAAVGLADYIQTEDLYEAGMGEEEEGMQDYIQTEGDGSADVADLYEAGMGEEEEAEVIGI